MQLIWSQLRCVGPSSADLSNVNVKINDDVNAVVAMQNFMPMPVPMPMRMLIQVPGRRAVASDDAHDCGRAPVSQNAVRNEEKFGKLHFADGSSWSSAGKRPG